MIFLLISAKIIKQIKRVSTELWSQMYCHLFNESQCIYGGQQQTPNGSQSR